MKLKEKINKLFSLIKTAFIKVYNFLSKNFKWIVLLIIVILLFFVIRGCNKLKTEKEENFRLQNNILAQNDTLKNYKDGTYNIADMRALQLKVSELSDSLKLEKNKTPITIVKYVLSNTDTIYAHTSVKHDTIWIYNTLNISDFGTIISSEKAEFGNSSRSISIETPYYVNCNDGLLYANGESVILLNQDIWVENILYKDKKGYTYMQLKTDYPGIMFNSGTAILVSDSKTEKKKNKQFGLGIGIQAGYGTMYNNSFKLSPYIGIGIGLQWNPRFLQF